MASIGLRKDLNATYDEALARLPEALQAEGFGILTEIDVASTLKKKIDVDFRRYKILGACSPPFAHQALSHDLEIGLMMPCNLVVYEGDDGKAVLMAVDPIKTIASAGDPKFDELAQVIKGKLQRVLDAMK